MPKFNVRAIPVHTGPAPPPPVPADKKPSAYKALKHGETNVVVMPGLSGLGGGEEIRRAAGGRPTKEDARKHKMAMASTAIAALLESKPSKAKIREYMEARIVQLTEEKR